MLDLNNKSILITGGTGSFGKKFTETVLTKWPKVKKIVVYSRDELKQYEMAQFLGNGVGSPMKYILGDVRDGERLKRAMEGIDLVIHAAALKQVPAAEENPMECIKTNILGAENIINAALLNRVQNVVALSSDKAAAPSNLYGASKLCAEKLFIAANQNSSKNGTRFTSVRYGNVIGSRGSVLPFFMNKKASGVIPVTHPEMTRFNISDNEVVAFIYKVIENNEGGEIYVPKLPSFKIVDLAEAIAPECRIEYTSIRPGEKIHEEMITEVDSINTYECLDHYVILPFYLSSAAAEERIKKDSAQRVKRAFKYSSDTNKEWLGVSELRKIAESLKY